MKWYKLISYTFIKINFMSVSKCCSMMFNVICQVMCTFFVNFFLKILLVYIDVICDVLKYVHISFKFYDACLYWSSMSTTMHIFFLIFFYLYLKLRFTMTHCFFLLSKYHLQSSRQLFHCRQRPRNYVRTKTKAIHSI